jgi:predicted amidohydrolase
MTRHRVTIAACAPASYGFVAPAHEDVTVRMIEGQETDPAAVRDHVERFLDHHERMLRRAAGAGANLAILPEDVLRLGGMIRRHRQEPGCRTAVAAAYDRCVERIGTVCRQTGMFVVAGTATVRNDRFLNTAVMIDPAGAVIATYDKTHLPKPEQDTYAPGDSLSPVDTPLGRIGLLICWDIVYPEPFAVLALQGADLVVQPTFGHWDDADDITARCRARDWSVPLAIGMWGGCAGIIDAEGNYAARTGRVGDSLAVASLDLDAPRKWLFMNDTRREKTALRRPDLYGPLASR